MIESFIGIIFFNVFNKYIYEIGIIFLGEIIFLNLVFLV